MNEPKIPNASHSTHQVHVAESDAREILNEMLRAAGNGEGVNQSELARLKQTIERVGEHAAAEETYPCSLCPEQIEAKSCLVLAVAARFEKDAEGNDVNQVHYGATGARNIIVCSHCMKRHSGLRTI